MGKITEVVEISLKAREQMSKPVSRVQKALNGLRHQLNGINDVSRMSTTQFKKVGNHVNQMGSAGARTTGRFRMMTAGS